MNDMVPVCMFLLKEAFAYHGSVSISKDEFLGFCFIEAGLESYVAEEALGVLLEAEAAKIDADDLITVV